jgi:hypothetical protein
MNRALALAMVLACALASFAGVRGVGASPKNAAVASGGERHRSITQDLDCGACHTPHGWKTLAGGAVGGGFDHARTGFPLTGRHQQTACTACHNGEGKLTRECVGCHADAHQRRLGEHCDDCHNSSSFMDVRALELHRLTRLPLTGMHALADCTACHQRIGDRRFSAVPADCYACHARDYRRTDIHPLHRGGVGTQASAPFPRDCSQCHRSTGWVPAVITPGELRTKLLTGALQRAPDTHELLFPIRRGAHKGALCSDCHRSEALPRAVQCTGCHAHGSVRMTELHRSVPAFTRGGACLSCHAGGAAR